MIPLPDCKHSDKEDLKGEGCKGYEEDGGQEHGRYLNSVLRFIELVNILAQRARLWVTPGRGKSALPPEGAREVVPMGLVIEQIFLFCPFLFLGLMFYIFSDHIRI